MKLSFEPAFYSSPALSAREQMALDLALLDRSNRTQTIIFRTFDWSVPDAITLGRNQPATLASDLYSAWARRPTGGGLVTHKASHITWSLVIPSSQFKGKLPRSKAVYSSLQHSIQGCLKRIFDTVTDSANSCTTAPIRCFDEPVTGDLVDQQERKVSGIALARNKLGLLAQGQIAVSSGSAERRQFIDHLAQQLCVKRPREAEIPWADLDGSFKSALQQQKSNSWLYRA